MVQHKGTLVSQSQTLTVSQAYPRQNSKISREAHLGQVGGHSQNKLTNQLLLHIHQAIGMLLIYASDLFRIAWTIQWVSHH